MTYEPPGDFAYYTVQYLWYISLYMAYIILLIIVGSAVDIGFFRYNSYGLQLVSTLAERTLTQPCDLLSSASCAADSMLLTSQVTRVHSRSIQTRVLADVQVFYFVWGNCMVSFGFMFSTFFNNTRTAVVAGASSVLPQALWPIPTLLLWLIDVMRYMMLCALSNRSVSLGGGHGSAGIPDAGTVH